jgi:rubrerythrin
MNLGTTGAIFTYALERENEIRVFYNEHLSFIVDPRLQRAFEGMINDQQKRDRLLNRLRRENVTEMILEPIHDFDSNTYKLVVSIQEVPDDSSIRDHAIKIEENSRSFFLKASEKTTFLPEVCDEFRRLANRAEKNVSLLRSLT